MSKYNINNPSINTKTKTFEQIEMVENKRENLEFKLLLKANLKKYKGQILAYKNSVLYPKNYTLCK